MLNISGYIYIFIKLILEIRFWAQLIVVLSFSGDIYIMKGISLVFIGIIGFLAISIRGTNYIRLSRSLPYRDFFVDRKINVDQGENGDKADTRWTQWIKWLLKERNVSTPSKKSLLSRFLETGGMRDNGDTVHLGPLYNLSPKYRY